MSNTTQTLIPKDVLLFDKDLLTHKDGFQCVSKNSFKLERLFDSTSMQYDKMTNYPIYLYRDEEYNYYCFSDKSLEVLQNNQIYHHKRKNPVEIYFVNRFTEESCKSEGKYHSDFLEEIDKKFQNVMKNIYKIDNVPVDYKIYYLGYNFFNNKFFTLSDVADLLLVYYNNYYRGFSSANERDSNYLLIDAQKRVNYKYACLTKAKYDSKKELKIDVGHEYKIKMLFLLADHYSFIRKDIERYFVGGVSSIKKYLQMIGKILTTRKQNFTLEDLNLLQTLNDIITLFQKGFYEFIGEEYHKTYKDVSIQDIIMFLKPSVIVKNKEEVVNEEVEEEKIIEIRQAKKKKTKHIKSNSQELIITEIDVDIVNFFRHRYNQVKNIYDYFERWIESHVKKHPFSFSICMNYLDYFNSSTSNVSNVSKFSYDEFSKILEQSTSHFSKNIYFKEKLVDLSRFFLVNYNRNNIICSLIKCDSDILSSNQINEHKNIIRENINFVNKKIIDLESKCSMLVESPNSFLNLQIEVREQKSLFNRIKEEFQVMYDQYKEFKKHDMIIFPMEDNSYEGIFNNYENNVVNKISIDRETFKSYLNKSFIIEKLLLSLAEKKDKQQTYDELQKLEKNIIQSQVKLYEINNILITSFHNLVQYSVMYLSTIIMKLCYYYNKLLINNDKIRVLDELQKIEKYKKIKNQSQNQKYSILHVLLQEDLQCANVEISSLLTQGFNTSIFNKAIVYQQEIHDNISDFNIIINTPISDLEKNVDFFHSEIFTVDVYNDYENIIKQNIYLQQQLISQIPSQFYNNREEQNNKKIKEFKLNLNDVDNELENIKTHKNNLLEFYYTKLKSDISDTSKLSKILDQPNNINVRLQELFDMNNKYLEKEMVFYYFYNDEFNNRNKELLIVNKKTLINVFENMIKSNSFTMKHQAQIILLIYCMFSSLFISHFYLKNKLVILTEIPSISIEQKDKDVGEIVELTRLTNGLKQSYNDLFVSKYKVTLP